MPCFGRKVEKATDECYEYEPLLKTTTDYSQWMTDLPEPLTKIPINKLAIPGSHDSGAFYLDPSTPIAPDESDVIKKFGSCAKSIVIKWGITQADVITKQLQNGIRYFDFRPGYLASHNDFLFVHGVYGRPVCGMLQEIQTFLAAHPREVAIVDINHFYNFTDALHQRFVGNVIKIFDKMIYTTDNVKGVSATLSDIRDSKSQVIIRYTEDSIAKQHKELWPSNIINSPWFNTDSTSTLITKLNGNFNNLQDGKLNVFQAILTPQTKTVILHITSSLRSCLADKCDAAVKNWLSGVYSQHKQGVNIVICDFVCSDQCVPAILKLNENIALEGK